MDGLLSRLLKCYLYPTWSLIKVVQSEDSEGEHADHERPYTAFSELKNFLAL